MIGIRENVFETNSSSTHSLSICSKRDYDAWRNGEALFNEDTGEFVKLADLYETCIKQVKKDIKFYSKDPENEYHKIRLATLKYALDHANKEFFDTFIKEVLKRNGKIVDIDIYGNDDEEEINSLYDLYDSNFEGATDEAVALELANSVGEVLITEEEYYDDDYEEESYYSEKTIDGTAVCAFGKYSYDG